MRFINTIMHGVLDYLIGIILIISPWIFDYYALGTESVIPICTGILILSISLMTDYEMSVLKIISMKAHLSLDLILGSFLALSPWIFQFSGKVYLPHLTLGAIIFICSIISTTKTNSDDSHTNLI